MKKWIPLLLLGALMGWFWARQHATVNSEKPEMFLIPDGYVGWVSIEYGVGGKPPLPMKAGFRVNRVPKSGRIQTSSPFTTDKTAGSRDASQDKFYYFSAHGKKPLGREEDVDTDLAPMIWGEAVGSGSVDAPAGKSSKHTEGHETFSFFVGDGKNWSEADQEPPMSPSLDSAK